MSTGRFFKKDSLPAAGDEYLQKFKSELDDLHNEREKSGDSISLQEKLKHVEDQIVNIYADLKAKRQPLVEINNKLMTNSGPIIKRKSPVQVRSHKPIAPSLKDDAKTQLTAINAKIENLDSQIKKIENLFPEFIAHRLDSPSSSYSP